MTDVGSLLDMSGQTVLVTGSTGTIGAAICQRLHEAGARVVCHYRSQAEAAQALVAQLGADTVAVQGHLDTAAGVTAFTDQLSSLNLLPDGLVNNAADQSLGTLAELSMDAWQQMLQTNLDGVFQLSQWMCNALSSHDRSGVIVNISSIEGTDPAPGHGHYATSKAGLNMLTRSMALETGRHMRVNSIAPGLIRRDGIETDWPEGVARWQERAPLGRLGEGADIADAVLFLLSDQSRWISGAHLVVDGGMSAQTRW